MSRVGIVFTSINLMILKHELVVILCGHRSACRKDRWVLQHLLKGFGATNCKMLKSTELNKHGHCETKKMLLVLIFTLLNEIFKFLKSRLNGVKIQMIITEIS